MVYEPRTYRETMKTNNSESFVVIHKETDLSIQLQPKKDVPLSVLKSLSTDVVKDSRELLERYIKANPIFGSSLVPLDVEADTPPIANKMAEAGHAWNVGPMAAVAGAFSQTVAEALHPYAKKVMIENGGDLFIINDHPTKIGLHAGDHSPFTGKVTLEVEAAPFGVSVCTSSGTVGHSTSFGKADAVVTVAESAYVADAAATGLANLVQSEYDIDSTIEIASKSGKLKAIVIAIGDKIGIWGDIKLVKN